ncbi:hypothetical protein A3D00_01930 [Candidatus Woesebacteria bacterium RIFCSPHIGHO2_02_FULL_38_9]|uniref:Methyltransferase type 11 domain-containing protein n=1 Tax=Candidatus Woesebacteria bacterium RIFCSPHIGHO2_01_FULL_39_28 TaxID=1802496 RepID=A0A1F7YI90_9BACT|nr:MAG: hypothetical protein A2627_02490 [Candidatus Woesebacteria bacterium RIFCSPHIGHO2_01_FULL_39_28]OGM32209.1 MAG: hypothetical protein A3D00_01930 [Candidatus Woesebacteria bacterium RIFCSPHIGHO2_02_FULL_38_9]OGM57196.1 MAG: hypothetical protein A3A50_03350 [Candidatus Woesebacteria bacterium RIFCSPLOWO2_01_FULL_38_20]
MQSSNILYEKRGLEKKESDFWKYDRNKMLPEFFPHTADNKKILDLACGSGEVASFFASLGYKVWGIDISENSIKNVKRLNIGNFRVKDLDDGKLPYETSFFDAVFWGDGIEHVFNPEGVLKEVKRVLKPKGVVVVSTPNTSYWLYRWHYLKTGEIPNTEGHIGPIWRSGHIRFFNHKLLSDLLLEAGFTVIKFKGTKRFWPNLFAPIILLEAKVKNES